MGRSFPIHVYTEDDVPVATFHSSARARAAVDADNAALDNEPKPVPDEREARWLKIINDWENTPCPYDGDETEDLVVACMALADEEQAHWVDRGLAADILLVLNQRDKAQAEVKRLMDRVDDLRSDLAELDDDGPNEYLAMVEGQRARALATIERVRAVTDKYAGLTYIPAWEVRDALDASPPTTPAPPPTLPDLVPGFGPSRVEDAQ